MTSRRIGWAIVGLALAALLIALAGGERGLQLFSARDRTWQAMQQRGAWRVGLDPSFPPFEQLDEQGQPIGFDVDLARQIAAQWGLDVEIVAIGFDSLLDAVRTGQIDSVVSAYPYDPRLTRDVRFSTPYFEAGIHLAVRSDSPLTAIEDLAGRVVAVEWGSMGDMVGRRLQRDEPTIHLAQFPTPDEALQALLADPTLDALLVDNITLRQAQANGARLRTVGPVLEDNPYVIVMPITDSTLPDQVERALQALRDQGVLNTLEERWFVAAP